MSRRRSTAAEAIAIAAAVLAADTHDPSRVVAARLGISPQRVRAIRLAAGQRRAPGGPRGPATVHSQAGREVLEVIRAEDHERARAAGQTIGERVRRALDRMNGDEDGATISIRSLGLVSIGERVLAIADRMRDGNDKTDLRGAAMALRDIGRIAPTAATARTTRRKTTT